jgi:hypothetical protein
MIVHVSKQRRGYFRRFRELGALSADRAVTLADARCRDSRIFRGLVERGIFVETRAGHFYLRADEAEHYLDEQRRLALVAILIATVGVGLLALLSAMGRLR